MTEKVNKYLFELFEPLRENRFIIKLEGMDIPFTHFRNYSLFNEGEKLVFTTEFVESTIYSFNPKDFFNIIKVIIEYLDPVGEVINALEFDVKGSNFERKQYYENDDLQLNKLRFIVNLETMKLRFENTYKEKN